MIRPDHKTTHLFIVGTISQWHEILRRLEEKHMETHRRCQLALLARVLLYSEKTKLKKEKGKRCSFSYFRGMFVATKFQL